MLVFCCALPAKTESVGVHKMEKRATQSERNSCVEHLWYLRRFRVDGLCEVQRSELVSRSLCLGDGYVNEISGQMVLTQSRKTLPKQHRFSVDPYVEEGVGFAA